MKELKEKIEAQKGKDYPAGGQKLIYAGVCFAQCMCVCMFVILCVCVCVCVCVSCCECTNANYHFCFFNLHEKCESILCVM